MDSNGGSDSNDGTSAATAFATLGALSGNVQNGDRIGLKRGGHFREQLTAYSAADITVAAYGSGERPIIDGSRVIPSGAWVADPDHAGVYYADVTHEVTTTPNSTDPNHSNTFHVCVWAGDTVLTGTFGGADIAANRTLVAATPGTFTAHLQNSSDADPRSGTGGTAYRYYVHLAGSAHPSTATMAYAEQQSVALLATGGTYHNLEFRRSATKDMVGMSNGTLGICEDVMGCVFRDPGCHGSVIRPKRLRNCAAYARGDGRPRTVGGYGFNFFYNESEGNYTPAIVARGNTADGFTTGIGSHGVNSGFAVHDTVTLQHNSTPNCTTGVAFALAVNSVTVEDHTALNCNTAVSIGQAETTVRRVSYLSRTTGSCTALTLYNDGTVEDSSFVFRTSGTKRLFSNTLAINTNAADSFVTLTLTRVSNKGGTSPLDSERGSQVNLRGSDNVLGLLSDWELYEPIYSIEMSNSYLSELDRTIAEMTAAGSVLTDCISPWRDEGGGEQDHSNTDLIWAGDPDTTGIAILDESSPLYALGMGRLT